MVEDDFLQGKFAGVSREKLKEARTEGVGDDEFGRGLVGLHGTQPAAEVFPNGAGEVDGEVLEESLSDATDLNVAVIGMEFPADGLSVRF